MSVRILSVAKGLLAPLIATGICAAQDGERLPLPQWDETLARIGHGPGAGFNNLLPPPSDLKDSLESGPPLSEALPDVSAGASGLSPHDLALFLHGSVLKPQPGSPGDHAPTAALALRPVPVEMVDRAYQSHPADHLIDPQGLVQEVLRDDLKRLLEFHAAESRVKLFILVMDADQKLPNSAVLDRVAQGALTRLDACLAIYPLGEPWRVRFLVSQTVHAAVPVQNLTQLATDCTQDALKAADSGQQLQRFAIRLSTRLFWLEKNLPAPTNHAPAPLQEVVQTSSGAEASRTADVMPLLLLWLALGSAAGFGFWLWFSSRGRWRLEARSASVWMLPDVESRPRLGGNFSGGTSAVIHYGSGAGASLNATQSASSASRGRI